jgi:thymidylate synthase ThyX
MKSRDIYLLDPGQFSQEIIAVTFAKTSRSPESFREIAQGLTEEKSADFHEKWVVGYGHASVAEHAVLHLAFENVSRLAIETIESNRLASYTEKSTRYQVFERDNFYTPANVAASKYAALYRDTLHLLFDTYFASVEPVRAVILQKYPRQDGENEKRYEGRIRSKWIDNCRYLLPTATLANVGMTANARVLEHAITKLVSHPLEEVREIGMEVKRVAEIETPTLVKYANRSDYVASQVRKAEGERRKAETSRDAVKLVDYDRDAEVKVVAACLYRSGGVDFEQARAQAQTLSADERRQLIGEALANRGDFDVPLRELEHTTLTFDCVMDQGAYFDVKRHRVMTQTAQPLSVDLGYALPKVIAEAGFAAEFDRAMQAAAHAYREIAAEFPHEATYVVPNAYNRRVLLTMNLRELFHFTHLRGAPNGHFAYRRVALKAYEIAKEVYPAFAPFMRCEKYPPAREIEQDFFERVA